MTKEEEMFVMLNAILDSIGVCVKNLLIFSLIPFIWWLITSRKKENFFTWLGFQKPRLQVKWWGCAVFAIAYVILYNFDGEFLLSAKTLEVLNSGDTAIAANTYASLGVAAFIPVFLTTFIGNGLAEEILFRGFFCKRFVNKTGVISGVLIQAFLFGAMHLALIALSGLGVGIDFYIYEFVYTFAGALMLALANEKIFNGSLWPSVFLHGLGNFISTMAPILGWW